MGEDSRNHRGNAHIRTIMANASEGFIITDGEGRIRVFNETASAMFDKSREECVGELIESVGSAQLATAVREALAGGTAKGTFQLQFGERMFGCKFAPFTNDASSGLAVIVRDDTELYEQQERAEAILAGVGDGLIVFTPDSRIAYANPVAHELLGDRLARAADHQISLAALLGLQVPSTEEITPCWDARECGMIQCPQFGSDDYRCWLRCGTPAPDGTPRTFEAKRERCAQCEVFRSTAPLLGEPGSSGVMEAELTEPEHRILEVRTNPVTDKLGRYLGCVSTLHDVTAAREIAVMKNEFVSMVSHELRTPLTSIKGYVDLIVDGEAGEVNEIQMEFLKIVQENSDRLVSLINEMLDISRIESGRVHLRIERLDMTDVIQGVLDTFRTYADQSGVTLEAHVGQDVPQAAADRDRVGQILMNLVSNAIKYSPGGGHVTIRLAHADGCVQVDVSDTGIGIAEEDQHQLFTKFFRVDSSLTREIGGTGLGLSIVKSVVELHGGRIWATSVEGEGSTFSFTLPVAPVELIRTPEVEGPEHPRGGTVLVVDHDADIADLVETYLVKRGYDVVKAFTGLEARRLAAEVNPVLITLDVMLDDGDGFELLQNLKEDPATSEIPVVVLSIVTDEGKSLRLGAADYLEKPIDKARLMKLIDDLIGAKASPVVLVVDDDRHIVDSLAHSLRVKGFAVAQAYDGREAMAAIEEHAPDLILLDLKMPVMDGYQVIQEVKTHEATEHIPIVVMTAHRIDHDKIDILKFAAEHMSKPFSPEALVERVESVLSKED
ncbi:MAG: hypothetical protein CVT60_07565 [Actinobacteria bacterium HGW-Actinobacteria-10]|nr:MAG: hypothetical protein CVT60_07565 [Actinobacteria bacterium HGW-Actinobacteria-10]